MVPHIEYDYILLWGIVCYTGFQKTTLLRYLLTYPAISETPMQVVEALMELLWVNPYQQKERWMALRVFGWGEV